jgi:hypothetical protein
MKTCTICNEEKLFEEFYKNKTMLDGRINQCKECVKIRQTNHRNGNIEYYREYDRKRGRTEKRKARCREYQKNNPRDHLESNQRYREKYPDKYHARNVLYGAVKSGKLVKPDCCEFCGETKKLHGHHEDYSKPLEVKWLCNDCHAKEHRLYKE